MLVGLAVLSWPGPVTPGPDGLPTWTYWAKGEAGPSDSTLWTMATWFRYPIAPLTVASKKSNERSRPFTSRGARTKPVDHVFALNGRRAGFGPPIPVNPALEAVFP